MKKSRKSIHPSIKICLGYPEDMLDDDFMAEWNESATTVCKPCWELKYCPYGPLVEDFPILPATKDKKITRHEYVKKCVETNLQGEEVEIREERRKELQELADKSHENLLHLIHIISDEEYHKKNAHRICNSKEESSKLNKKLLSVKAKFPIEITLDNLPDKKRWEFIKDVPEYLILKAKEKLEKIDKTLVTGIEDFRQPLADHVRTIFQKEFDNYSLEKYPDYIPESISDMQCNVFGHMCPIAFVSEGFTETSKSRQVGRYISFHTKMRIVRRDNHTCQICGKHLKDDEVEFDHIIPIAKGGSSEEHNIRLTCFDCNRN